MGRIILSRFILLASSAVLAAFIWPSVALPQPAGGAVTKGSFVERFFVNRFSRSPKSRDYVPANLESLPPAERYAAVVKGLNQKGVMVLVGGKPDDPLTRVEYITLTYILAGGAPGKSLAEQKAFLRAKGAISSDDVGFVKAFQGDVTVTRTGQEQGLKVTGAEPVLFRDVDETAVGAKVELQFDDGSVLSIGEDTAMTIDEMVYDPASGRRSIQLRMTVGTIKVNAAPNSHPQSRFNVLTPTMVTGVRGTIFGVSVDTQGNSKVVSIEGRVGVRPLTAAERRPPRPAERRAAARRGAAPPPAGAPAQAGPQQEVVVQAGQTAEVTTTTVGPASVRQATAQETQQVSQATTITAPAEFAAVTTTQVQQTNVIVQVQAKESTTNTVTSKQETRQVVATTVVVQDKGKATEDTVQEGKDTVGTTTTTLPTTSTVSLTGLTGTELKNAFLRLTDDRQAEEFGKLTSTQQADLANQLSQTEAEGVLARFKPSGSAFTSAVLKSLFDFGVAFEDVSTTVTDREGRTGTSRRVGELLDKLTPEQAVEFANCEHNYPSRRCVGSDTAAGNFDWFGLHHDDDLTAVGVAVATALSRRLDFLATSGGVLPVPSGATVRTPGTLRQMLLATVAPDDVIPQDTTTYTTFFNGHDPWFAAVLLLTRFDDISTPASVTNQSVRDIWGGEMRPAAYSLTGVSLVEPGGIVCTSGPCNNGGYQAGQLRASATSVQGGSSALIDVSSRVGALNNNGFLSYAVQVEEDLVNSTAKAIYHLSGGASPAFPGSGLASLVDSQLFNSEIRAKDAFWQQSADARAGLVFFNAQGNRVRAQQYVYRHPLNTDEVRMVSVTVGERRTLSYIDLRVGFQSGQLSGKTASQIRDLPWNSYFSIFYTGNPAVCASSGCNLVVGSPAGSPLLSNLRVERGNETPGEYIREELLNISSRLNVPTDISNVYNFAGTQFSNSQDIQFVDGLHRLTILSRAISGFESGKVFQQSVSSYDPRLGSTLSSSGSIPSGQFRLQPVHFDLNSAVLSAQDANNPAGFDYRVNDNGTIRDFTVRFAVLGDSTTSANSGRQTSTCGASGTSGCGLNDIKFDTIWDAFRVNLDGASQNPQGLPTIIIGANILGIRSPAVLSLSGNVVFSQDIRGAFIPFPRMIWRGEPGF